MYIHDTTVLVEGFRLQARIGHDKKKQTVSVGFSCSLNKPNVPNDLLSHTFDYYPIIKKIKTIAQSKSRHLIETFAQEIAELCFENVLVEDVVVSVRKVRKIENVAAVGVTRTFKRR
jgi:dihydroneopterin aldolase